MDDGAALAVIDQAGIDTWSPAWYLDEDDPVLAAVLALATSPAKRGRVLPEKIAGHTIGCFPGQRMVYAEGHPGGDRLGSPDALPEALCALETGLRDYGLPMPRRRPYDHFTVDPRPRSGFAGIRRLDTTLDLSYETTAEGLAVLAGIAAVAGQVVHRSHDLRFPETVLLKGRSGRTTLGRVYDKGVESGSAPRGRLIRPEDQRRYPREARRDVEELTTSYVREQFIRRFTPLWRATKGVVTVSGPLTLASKLCDAIEEGEVSPREARMIAGDLLMASVGAPASSRRTRFRHRARARSLGLVFGDGVLEEVEVDLHDVLDEVLETDAWNRRD